MKKIVAVLIAFLMLLSSTMIGGSAITVERDGAQYILRSHTPATGDINVLMVRVGFADYDVDDEDYPADSEETLLSYFDGSEDSINSFYEISSYGKLRLHCDKVYSYNAMYDRDSYDDEDYYASYDLGTLMTEALSALEDEIDLEKYDSDGDGYLDFVCFDFSGPMGDWGTTWWPHVNHKDDFEIGGKKIYCYSFLRGDVSVFIHEFGHILGACDYYSTDGSSLNSIMTYDMMSNNTGDHDGFTKWSYGWIGDDDIVFVDKSSGVTTVDLTPIDSSVGGKKIAVVAPEIDPSNGFIDEYFLVEYDSGEGNNAAAFDQFSLEPGFRIFHVNADCFFYEGETYIHYMKDNSAMRDNLVHNVKNESDDPYAWGQSDMLYHEGDSLTPEGYPNTGLSVDGVYNGLYTGICFTDFVTGDKPSFKVSFSDDPAPEVDVKLTLDYEELFSDVQMTLTSDTTVTARLMMSLQDMEKYTPYLIDENGEKLTLFVEASDPCVYKLSYQNAYPIVKPDTEYTLVIPEGYLKAGYSQDVPEFRQKVVTDHFLSLSLISTLPNTDMETNTVPSNLFAVTDNTYGVVRIPLSGEDGRFTFTEYNLNGEEISSLAFDAPDYDSSDDRLYRCNVKKLNDGNFALIMYGVNNYFVKIDRQGNTLSKVYTVSDDSVYNYVNSVMNIDFDLYKDGLCKLLINDDWEAAMLVIDFESEPELTVTDQNYYYYSLNSKDYVEERFYDHQNHVLVYNADDEQEADIGFDAGFLCAFEENGHVTVLKDRYDRNLEKSFIFADSYTKTGELIESKDITDNAKNINYYGVFPRCHVAEDGYFLESEEPNSKVVIAYDKNWNWLGTFTFDLNSTYTFVGNCGLTKRTQYDVTTGVIDIISRFNVGDIEIVPAQSSMILGDADGDGTVNVLDATLIQRADVQMVTLSPKSERLADVDKDGAVCIIDATWIQRYDVGMKAPEGIGRAL